VIVESELKESKKDHSWTPFQTRVEVGEKSKRLFSLPPDFVVIVVVAPAGMAATPIFTGLCRNRIIFDPHRPYQPSHLLGMT
jgi:hypothetical protein